ncbi:SBBP repeat-containing protein [Paraburkholderia sp. C35]|uniref:SBBP repeat-containing protein n=1 Tax=Paraburkholderia sp. C35 TaxID=2126993 RepID=UPI0013A5AF2A|nr:SBBP repeat-containing protein [Paraburkholderia sp. C35]
MKLTSTISNLSTISRVVAATVLAGFLGACGGGGSSSPSSGPTPVTGPTISIFAGMTTPGGYVDGAATKAQFNLPQGLANDPQGDLFVADTANYTIRKITNGVVSTFAGTPGQAGSADGMGTGAQFAGPWMMASDSAGNLYVTDQAVNATAAVIRKITPAGQVTTLKDASTGLAIQTDGGGAIAVDGSGNVYVFTSTPSQSSVLAQITPAGVVNLISLTSASGGGALALVNPQGIAVDSSNNIYVSDDDLNANAGVLYKIALNGTAGVATTLAGTTAISGATDGPGNVATFSGLDALTLDSSGNVFASDFNNSTIREISPAGGVSTVAGVAGQTNLQTGPLPATLPDIGGLLWTGGALYATDIDDNVVLSIGPLQ